MDCCAYDFLNLLGFIDFHHIKDTPKASHSHYTNMYIVILFLKLIKY